MSIHIDTLIIGGGIVGLSIALELKKKHPLKEIVLCEESEFYADQTSGRNSGVLHSGIYYKKESLKQKLTKRGLELWNQKEIELGLSINRCGKFIVADDLEAIKKLWYNAIDNLVEVGEIQENLEELKDFTFLKYSFFVPSTANVCVPDAVAKIFHECERLGVILLNRTHVDIKQDVIYLNDDIIYTDNLVNCAGLKAVEVRKKLGLFDIENHYVIGHYLKYSKNYYNSSLIYPLPNEELNTLGIHTCFDIEGNIFFGPSAEKVSEVNYAQSDNLIEKFYSEISNSFVGVEKNGLSLHYAGIRPKVMTKNEIQDDFILRYYDHLPFRYTELLGIESPGLTCAFSIAEMIVDKYIKL